MKRSIFDDPNLPDSELKTNTRLINISAVTVGLLCLIASPIFISNNAPLLGWLLLPQTVVYFCVPVLAKHGNHLLARWALYVTFNFGTFFYLNLLGHGLGLEYLYVASIFIGLFLFRTLYKRIFATMVVIVLIIIGDFNLIPWLQELPLTEESKFWIRTITLPGTLIIISGAILATYIRYDQRVEALSTIIQIARTDDMTQLGNRFSFKQDHENSVIKKSPESALVLLDLNGLKTINDQYGHSSGDQLLKRFANDLVEAFPDAKAYRFGGDEFVLWIQIPAGIEASLSQFSTLVSSYEEDRQTGVAYGITYGREVNTVEEMIDQSDSRMYQHKSAQSE